MCSCMTGCEGRSCEVNITSWREEEEEGEEEGEGRREEDEGRRRS